ncbi:carboxypeptidase regulatory-like domain-containing protein [Sphingobacterium puteale]|uniref:Carboxypeptidase regulatory-like domain-containing protein n=1 Tax=Sphingobacterium puteale TaxID=2420510 RepID=A0A420W4X9_9SPHI|nr:carboxypeptidase regulatory-like domain-containing protein [Sphingobacterium puteale]RKO73672.1 carboxypeptidase regulatory-like domain-containing protein [Sphingobacterium puteale]
MKLLIPILLVLSIFFDSSVLKAQEKKIIQYSGIVTTVGSGLPVGYATVTNLSFRNEAVAANNEGYFSFVAHVGDTIRFTSVGFDPLTITIPKVSGDKYTANIVMQNLVTELPMVTPYPWASIEEFNIAFMNLDVSEDNIVRARRSLSYESLSAMAAVVPRDGNEMRSINNAQSFNTMNNKVINQRYANPLLNPFAWGSLIQQITKGSQSRSKSARY